METFGLELHTSLDLPTNVRSGYATSTTIDLTFSSTAAPVHQLHIATTFTSLGHQPIFFEVLDSMVEADCCDCAVHRCLAGNVNGPTWQCSC